MIKTTCKLLSLLLLPAMTATATALDWSVNEVHVQYGELDVPTFKPGPKQDDTLIVTYQHASGWAYGDSFLFVDWLDGSDNKAFNDHDLYGEFYHNLSLGKVLDRQLSFGPVKDIGLLTGINYARDSRVLKYLPGIRFDLALPSFAFAHLDMMAYIDDSKGVVKGGAPAETDSWLVDFNWALPFTVGDSHWSLQGHVEYVAERHNEFGAVVSDWLLAQPQLRFDLGEWLLSEAGKLYVGLEYQYWHNKLSDTSTDESAVQALLVWRL